MRRIPALAILATLPAIIAVLAGGPASALSCAAPEGVVAKADTVVAGTISDAKDGDLVVAVREIWKGELVPRTLPLGVDLASWSEWSPGRDGVPDGYRSQRIWVFALETSGRFAYRTSPCSAWPIDQDGIAEMRPAVVRSPGNAPTPMIGDGPAPAPSDREEFARWRFLAGAGTVVVLGTLLVGLRRRRVRSTH